MSKRRTIGLIAIALTTIPIFVDGLPLFWRITGGICAFIAGFMMLKNSATDKQEIIQTIENTSDVVSRKIEAALTTTSNPETIHEINSIANDFNIWAEEFKKDFSSRQLQFHSNRLAKQKEVIDISQEQRKYYEVFIQLIKEAVSAYSGHQGVDIKITQEHPIPLILYNAQPPMSVLLLIDFSGLARWLIFIEDRKSETRLPFIKFLTNKDIIDRYLLSLEPILLYSSDMFVDINTSRNQIAVQINSNNQNPFVEGKWPLDDYRTSFKEIIKNCFEQQLVFIHAKQ